MLFHRRNSLAHRPHRALLFFVVQLLLVSALVQPLTAERPSSTALEETKAAKSSLQAASYLDTTVQSLVQQGFPLSYAQALAPLAIAHPNWSFEALQITESWKSVLAKESENPATNLISKSKTYAAYRHATNKELYDNGYYQVSTAALAYFMDPRNFMNEKDIFQFYCFADSAQVDVTSALSRILSDTFMEQSPPNSQKSYAEIFVDVGNALGIDPIYLAVRARQEQGVLGSATISGVADQVLIRQLNEGEGASGDTAESLSAYRGYYNIYNIGATGKGSYAILKAAMNRAIKGTEEKSADWGGSPSWNTVEKSIYGGAKVIYDRYIKNDQNTAYLQKFNVSPRSTGRFWKQYMQNVVAALSEGRTLYTAFAAADALDCALTFRIPVYSGMDEAYPDPADGSCSYTAGSATQYDVGGTLHVGDQSVSLPDLLPSCVASGNLPTFSVSAQLAKGLRIHGKLWADRYITSATLTPCYLNGSAYEGRSIQIYQNPYGCGTLHMSCSYSLPATLHSGDTITYALTITMGQNDYAKTLTVALLEVHIS